MEVGRSEGIPAVRTILPRRYQDERGFFSEIWREDALRRAGVVVHFVQENQALSNAAGTVRGLHFQIGESVQAKLIRCVAGSIFDVAVDIRHGSPTFGHHVAVELSAENCKQLFIPAGFAHGYCTLEPRTEVVYKVSAFYDPASERGLAWDDPALGIAWPVVASDAIIAAKDRAHPGLVDLPDYFPFEMYA